MAALRPRLLSSSTYAGLDPRIGNTLLDAVFPTLVVASPSPSDGGDLCGLSDLPSWLLRPGAGAGAAAGHQATLGRASAFEGRPHTLALELTNLRASPHILAGLSAGAVISGLAAYAFSEESKVPAGYGFLSLGEEFLSAGMIYCNVAKEGGNTLAKNGNGGGSDQKSPPPPPPRDLTPNEKKLFLKLLIELQHNLSRLLHGKEHQDLEVDLSKKKS